MSGTADPIFVGADSVDQNLKASLIESTEVAGEYKATLHIHKLKAVMTGKSNKFTAWDDEGRTEYKFRLELGEAPPAGQFEGHFMWSLYGGGGMCVPSGCATVFFGFTK